MAISKRQSQILEQEDVPCPNSLPFKDSQLVGVSAAVTVYNLLETHRERLAYGQNIMHSLQQMREEEQLE